MIMIHLKPKPLEEMIHLNKDTRNDHTLEPECPPWQPEKMMDMHADQELAIPATKTSVAESPPWNTNSWE